jgi:deoxyribodipyrimidine photolyase-like uncharacterized protein
VETLEDGLERARRESPFTRLTAMEPSGPQLAERLRTWAARVGVELVLVPNELWLTSRQEWDAFARGGRSCAWSSGTAAFARRGGG